MGTPSYIVDSYNGIQSDSMWREDSKKIVKNACKFAKLHEN